MTVADESDETLMMRYGRGDAAAFDLLYRRHEMRVWRYLERNVGNRATADELMQEVWFAVARDALRYEPSARFTTWLFTIAHNRMIDCMRTSRRQTSLETLGYEAESVVEQLTSDPGAGPLAAAVARDQAGALAGGPINVVRGRTVDLMVPAEAEALLIRAFLGEAIEGIEHAGLREALMDAVVAWLEAR